MNSEQKLKPCPFCGCKAIQVSGEYRDGGYQEYTSYVKCECCGSVSQRITESLTLPAVEEIAAEAWNSRANECDRDELLKVADEIGVDAEHIAEYLDSCEGTFTKDDADEYHKLAGWHDRIRKALGVE